ATGLKPEYTVEFDMASRQITALAQAMPADKFDWRPGIGVRSVGEVYVHIAETNVLLLSYAGTRVDFAGSRFTGKEPVPEVIAHFREYEKTVHGKDKILAMLKQTLDAVKTSFAAADLEKPVDLFGRKTTTRAVYLRILAHINEHMGQSIAYARMNGVVPPWSK
ncbi:MAG TPA: DinB family protein, partial [Bryobacteraceae bacterium]